MKVTIVNAYGRSNRGDSVLLDECISDIKKTYNQVSLSVSIFDDYEVDKIHSDIVFCERVCQSSIRNKLIKPLFQVWIIIAIYLSVKFNLNAILKLVPKNQQETIHILRDADLIVSAPGGYIHDTNFAYLIALFHIHISNLMNKKVMLAPQSIGPINSFLGRLYTKHVLRSVHLICVREGFSKNFLCEQGISQDKIVHSGDSAFWNLDVDYSHIEDDFFKLGIKPAEKYFSVTVVNWTFPYADNPTLSRTNYIKAIARTIDYIYVKFKLRTVILNQVKDDIVMAEEIYCHVKNKIAVVIDKIEKEPSRLRALISKSQAFIGTRFHSCIFSLMAFVPTIAIGYLPKTNYIMKDLHLDDLVYDINNFNVDGLLNTIDHQLQHPLEVKNRISTAVSEYRNSKLNFMDVLDR